MRQYSQHMLYLLGFFWLVGCGYALPTPAPPATPQVTVSQPVPREVSEYADLPGGPTR
jgi:hypothetical protein